LEIQLEAFFYSRNGFFIAYVSFQSLPIVFGSNSLLKHLPKHMSSSQIVDLAFLYFIFHFYFHIVLFFYFSIFRTTRVKVDQSRCHISHNLMGSHKTDHETWENLVEDSRTDDVIQHGHHMLTSWTTHGCLG